MNKFDTLTSRVKAKILDFFILIPFCLFFISVAFWEIPFLREPQIQKLIFLSPLFVFVFYPIVMNTLYGQTFGKMAAKVKVVDVFEKPIIFGQAVLRSVPQIAFLTLLSIYVFQNENAEKGITRSFFWYSFCFLIFFKLSDYVCAMALDKNRSLHDLLGRTVVIRTDV